MRVANDTFLVSVDSDRSNTLNVVGLGGKKLVIDVDYNKYKHTTQIGEVCACPIHVTSKYIYDTPIEVGDKVVFHHFVCQPDHKIKFMENVYRAEYFHIYAKIVKDSVVPVEDVVFVEPIKESNEDLYCGVFKKKSVPELVKQRGAVFASSRLAKESGILPGDIVFFTKNAEYEMKLIDKMFYRMRIRNIVCVERNGKIMCPKDKVMVKVDSRFIPDPGLLKNNESYQMQGEVVDFDGSGACVEVGSVVNFHSPVQGGVSLNGEVHYFLEPRHINYIKI